MDLETTNNQLQRVYGDFGTPVRVRLREGNETVEDQAIAFTKWGITVSDSIALAADAAATGFVGQ